MDEEGIVLNKGEDLVDLPPGFRFHPTDEEIITHYLTEKVMNHNFTACAVGEVDLNKCEPWDLPKRAKMGEKEFYFFCQRDRKYPTGMRTNRATESGYWKATGKDKEIFKGKNNLVGMKKTLVFYKGRAPKGEKTNWVMHEYRHEGKFSYYNLPKSARDEWVVCRVFHKSVGIKKTSIHDLLTGNSFCADDFVDYSSLPPLIDPQSSSGPSSSSFNEGDQDHEFKGNINNNNYTLPQFNPNYLHHYQNSNPVYPQQQQPFHSQNIPNFAFQTTPNMPGVHYFQNTSFGQNDQTLLRTLANNMQEKQCKTEQFSSNQSMATLSQETGLSSDINTAAEISSVVSKQEFGSNNNKVFNDLVRGSSSIDLQSLWDDY